MDVPHSQLTYGFSFTIKLLLKYFYVYYINLPKDPYLLAFRSCMLRCPRFVVTSPNCFLIYLLSSFFFAIDVLAAAPDIATSAFHVVISYYILLLSLYMITGISYIILIILNVPIKLVILTTILLIPDNHEIPMFPMFPMIYIIDILAFGLCFVCFLLESSRPFFILSILLLLFISFKPTCPRCSSRQSLP